MSPDSFKRISIALVVSAILVAVVTGFIAFHG